MSGATKQGAVADFTGESPGTQASLSMGINLGAGYTLQEGSLKLINGASETLIASTGPDSEVYKYDNGFLAVVKGYPGKVGETTLPQEVVDYFGKFLRFNDVQLSDGTYDRELTDLDREYEERFTGTVKHTAFALLLNGSAVDLQHSSFGGWALEGQATGTWEVVGGDPSPDFLPSAEGYTEVAYIPFFGGDAAREVAPARADSFTGTVLAQVQKYGASNSAQRLTGDATLTLASATSGSMKFEFPGFYDITFGGLGITSNGRIHTTDSGPAPTLVDHGNTTGITFGENITPTINAADVQAGMRAESHPSFLVGQFYGDNGAASEAAGAFGLHEAHSENYVYGSFGVKK
jgi:hypothetical protein